MGREKPWKEWKDDELVVESFNRHAEASVEMMRRLKRSNEVLAIVNIALASALVFLTAVLVVVTVYQLRHSS